jgi:hypothetical protein
MLHWQTQPELKAAFRELPFHCQRHWRGGMTHHFEVIGRHHLNQADHWYAL